MDKKNLTEIRSRLWNSAEMAHVRFNLIAWAAAYAFALVMCIPGGEAGWMGVFLFSAMLLPFLVFWVWRLVNIFRRVEAYTFCRTELDQPHHFPMSRGMFTFMGVIEDEGRRFAVETHAIFQAYGSRLVMQDYIGKTVTLAWNRETDMVVVIG